MRKSNLVSLLKSFSKEEFKNFGRFVRSPFFNSRKDIVRYYIYLKKYYPHFNKQCFSKENIFSHVYPGRKFNNNEFLKLNSSLNHLCMEFLRHKPDKVKDELKILGELEERNLGNQFLSMYKALNDYIDNKSEMDSFTFVNKVNLSNILIRYHMNRDRQIDICSEIINRGNYFAYQSLLWIMIQMRDMTTNFNSFNYPFKNSNSYKFITSVDIEKFMAELIHEDNRLGRFMKYYLYSMMIYLHPDNDNYFENFKCSFSNIYSDVNWLERNNYLSRMQSYVMKHFQEGNPKYLDELVETYRTFFGRKGIFENEIIPFSPFRNCFLLALHFKDYSFANDLIENYSGRLNEELREDAVKLCLAYLYFDQKDYKNVIDILRILHYRYATHKLDVKILLLKTYFENGDYDYLMTFSDSFRHFLANNTKITPAHRNHFNNLISATNHLCTLKMKNNVEEMKRLRTQIAEDNQSLIVFDKLWLLQKLDEAVN